MCRNRPRIRRIVRISTNLIRADLSNPSDPWSISYKLPPKGPHYEHLSREKIMSKAAITFLLLLVASLTAQADQPPPALFGRLTVNQTHIVFSYAGDLWSVERSGGEAHRLTTHPGEESFPVFSPDGSQLAFSRQIGGNWDIYVMPAAGGDAKQV